MPPASALHRPQLAGRDEPQIDRHGGRLKGADDDTVAGVVVRPEHANGIAVASRSGQRRASAGSIAESDQRMPSCH